SFERSSSKMISSPGTKLYLDHRFVDAAGLSEAVSMPASGEGEGDVICPGVGFVPFSLSKVSIALLVSLVTFCSVLLITALSAAAAALFLSFPSICASALKFRLRQAAIMR